MNSGSGLIPFAISDADRERKRAVRRMVYEIPEFDPRTAADVVESIALGRRITAIGDTPGMPAYFVINAWRSMYPEFDEAVVMASEAAADMLYAETLDIADNVERSPACREVSIRARHAWAKVLNRKKYDPAIKVDVSDARKGVDEYSNEELAAMIRRKQRAEAEDVGE